MGQVYSGTHAREVSADDDNKDDEGDEIVVADDDEDGENDDVVGPWPGPSCNLFSPRAPEARTMKMKTMIGHARCDKTRHLHK